MEPDKKDVNNAPESSTEEHEINQVVEQPAAQDSTTESAAQTQVQSPSQGTETEVDEKGVPWQNREAELRRKVVAEIMPALRQTLQEELRQSREAQSNEAPASSSPKYTLQDLDWIEENHPEHANWVKLERLKMIKAEAAEEAYNRLKKETEGERNKRESQEAIQSVISRFPELLDKSTNQWNVSNPLYQRAMQVYGRDPSYRNHPRGLEAAVTQAFGELAYEQRSTLQKQQTKITAQERKTQKMQAQAITAGGQATDRTPAPKSNDKLLAEYARTRDPRIMAEILRSKGIPVPTS